MLTDPDIHIVPSRFLSTKHSQGMCLARVPTNGRNFEYQSGEDPYLGKVLVEGTIRGIQSQGVVANAKHYILNNQETNRNSINVLVDERTLYEMYIPPFSGAVSAGVGSFMCSYNRVGGDFSCEHNATLNQVSQYPDISNETHMWLLERWWSCGGNGIWYLRIWYLRIWYLVFGIWQFAPVCVFLVLCCGFLRYSSLHHS